jgi:hypothetical protein
MVCVMKSIKTLVAAAAIISWLASPAYSQGLGKRGGGYAGPPVENRPKIDEKAYNAALQRIPTPKQPYDPWSNARPSDPASTGGTTK